MSDDDWGGADSARSAKPGTTGEVSIVRMDGRGDGHSPHDVVVAGAFPRERAHVRITARGRNASYADLLELLVPHPGRRAVPCPQHRDVPERRSRCDGCPLMGVDEATQRELKRTRLAELGLDVDTVVPSPRPLGYRWSAKRLVSRRGEQLVLGSRCRGSDVIADMDGCRVDDPRLVAAFASATAVGQSAGWRTFDEDPARGWRYAWAKTDGERVSLTLLGGPKLAGTVRAYSEAIRGVDQLAFAISDHPGNAIRGEAAQIVRGEPLRWRSGSLDVTVGPLGFLQPNPSAIDRAYDDLVRDADGTTVEGTRAWDLYAGAGAIHARLQHGFATVDACESYAEGAAALGVEPRDVEAFVREHVQSHGDTGDDTPELIVANPPRAGLKGAAQWLNGVACERLHMMSCNPESLVRDLRALTSFELVAARAYDTLPQTAHVEVVVWLRRR